MSKPAVSIAYTRALNKLKEAIIDSGKPNPENRKFSADEFDELQKWADRENEKFLNDTDNQSPDGRIL